jgi:hypothetical protein
MQNGVCARVVCASTELAFCSLIFGGGQVRVSELKYTCIAEYRVYGTTIDAMIQLVECWKRVGDAIAPDGRALENAGP